MNLKVLQWNIGGSYIDSGLGEYEKLDVSYVLNVIRNIDPDICCLQEVHINEELNQAEKIAKELGFYSVYDSYDDSHIEVGQKLSQAVLSKYKINNHDFKLFHNPLWEFIDSVGQRRVSHYKGITSCEIELPVGLITVQTLHLIPFRIFGKEPLSDESRLVKESIDSLINSYSGKSIVCGDFNYSKEVKSLKDFLPNTFMSGFSETPLNVPTTPRGGYYDRILYKGSLYKDVTVFNDVKTDHYPVVASFEY